MAAWKTNRYIGLRGCLRIWVAVLLFSSLDMVEFVDVFGAEGYSQPESRYWSRYQIYLRTTSRVTAVIRGKWPSIRRTEPTTLSRVKGSSPLKLMDVELSGQRMLQVKIHANRLTLHFKTISIQIIPFSPSCPSRYHWAFCQGVKWMKRG